MEISRRDLLNDMVEHKPILKTNHVSSPFSFHTQNRYSIPQNGDFVLNLQVSN